MVVTCVHVSVRREFIEDFIVATRDNHIGTRKEPGNLRFDILQLETSPQKFMLYEVFESEDAANFHKTTPHYIKWRDSVQNWMEQPRQGARYNIVEPKGKDQW